MILLFSGTGNSLHVANLLSARLGDEIITLPLKNGGILNKDFERIIWVFPVYSWGVPPVVSRWIKEIDIPRAEDVAHHAVMTCGDDIGQADMMWRKEIEARGWRTAGTFSVQMPNTYVLMKGFDVDSESLAEEKIKAAASRVEEISEKIVNLPHPDYSDVVRGGFAWIKTKLIYPYFVKFEMSPKPFHSTTACTGCGVCARSCPLANITMIKARDGHPAPAWGQNCALCLGCYHACPHHAVAYGKITKNKGQKKILKK